MKVYEMILEQLGGINKLKAMIGAKDFLYSSTDENFIEFYFKGCEKANHVVIEYIFDSDLYKVTFVKVVKKNGLPQKTLIKEFTDVYSDMLIPTFENFTGLYLSL